MRGAVSFSNVAFGYRHDRVVLPEMTLVNDELTKLAQLRDSGVITSEQFEAQKAKILA